MERTTITQCLRGGEEFAEIYALLAPRLHAFFTRRLRDAALVEDLVQQTLINMYVARDRFIAGRDVGPWALTIARRLLIDAVRRSRREPTGDPAAIDVAQSDSAGADDVLAARELAERLAKRFDTLPPPQRDAFELVRMHGLSVSDAARRTGTTEGALKLRTHRASESLREMLNEAA